MEISATADEENFLPGWQFSCGTRQCEVHMGKRPLVIKDVESGQQVAVETVRRVFRSSRPQVNLLNGLEASIPAFGNVPVDQRRYTLSMALRHEFEGPLPDRVWIRMPPITINGQTIEPPVLELIKQETGRNIRHYVPAHFQTLSRTAALSNFAGAPGWMTRRNFNTRMAPQQTTRGGWQ